MLVKQWSFGDRVVHAGRPEWGVGVIAGTQAEQHEGRSCQRLTIRFERAGMKTISTALADLRPESELPMLGMPATPRSDDPLLAPAGPTPKDVMLKLPDAATDPFKTSRARLEASLAMYRFSDQPSSLLDWAVAQSGLKDPMTRFSRHELEDMFKRWTQLRDEHLKELCFALKKTEPGLISEALRTAPRAALHMLKRFDGPR